MKPQFLCLISGLLMLVSIGAHASPEEDRKMLLDSYAKALPTIKFEDYIFGALALNAEAREQYDSMMEFPPFTSDVHQGGMLWEKPFKNNERFASCFKYGGNNVAGNYPYFDDASGRVVTFENAINDCLKANNEKELEYGSKEMALLTAYAKSLSDDIKIHIKVNSPGALAAYEKGKQTYFQRRGQLNFACATCHVDNAGKYIRSEQLSMMVGQAAHWPEFRAGTEVVTLQGRFTQCLKNTRTEPRAYNSEEYNNLEYFMTYMSNGLKLKTPVFRK